MFMRRLNSKFTNNFGVNSLLLVEVRSFYQLWKSSVLIEGRAE